MNENIISFLQQKYVSVVARTYCNFICTNTNGLKFFIKVRNISSIEQDILNKLNHPNIINLLDYLIFEDNIFLEFPFIEGNELYLMRSNINWKNISKDLISPISYLINKGYVHCDITPSNILISENKTYLIDFSHAIQVGKSISVYPTIFHAPEVLSEKPHKYSDLYSLGAIILYLLLNDTDFEILIKNKNDGNKILLDYINSSYLDKKVSNLILGLLHLDPEKRYTYFLKIQEEFN